MAYNRAKDEAWRQKCWLCRFETSGPLDETPTAVFFVPAMTKGVVAFRGPLSTVYFFLPFCSWLTMSCAAYLHVFERGCHWSSCCWFSHVREHVPLVDNKTVVDWLRYVFWRCMILVVEVLSGGGGGTRMMHTLFAVTSPSRLIQHVTVLDFSSIVWDGRTARLFF